MNSSDCYPVTKKKKVSLPQVSTYMAPFLPLREQHPIQMQFKNLQQTQGNEQEVSPAINGIRASFPNEMAVFKGINR